MFRRRHHWQATTPRLESLEARTMFSADISLVAGVVTIQGSGHADEIDVVRESTSVVVRAGHGEARQTQTFAAREVRELVVRGGAGDDRIFNGTNLPSTIDGGDGDDILIGGTGRDILNGGSGSDLIVAGDGNDLVFGGEGSDRIYGGRGHDLVFAEGGADMVLGEAGNDILDGGLGDDAIFGGDDLDWLYGGPGNDLLSGNSGTDVAYGGVGDDLIFGGTGGDYLFGEGGNDHLVGGAGYDVAGGGSGLNAEVAEGSNGPDEPYELAAASLAPLVDSARDRWSRAGFDVVPLGGVRYRVTNLPGSHLALATREADGSQTIWLDDDAAGQGWFLDSTPHEESEFSQVGAGKHVARPGSAAQGRVDLLTVLSHEMGHVLGFGHSAELNVMSPVGLPGVRLAPHHGLIVERTAELRVPFVEALVNVWSNGVREYGNNGSSPFYLPIGGLGYSNADLNWLFLSPNSPFSSRSNYTWPTYFSPYSYWPAYSYNPYAYSPVTRMGYGPSGVFGFGG